MRGKTRTNDGGLSKSTDSTTGQLPTIVVPGGGSIDSGKPDTSTVTSKPDSDAAGIAPPVIHDFGAIEAEDPIVTRIDTYASGTGDDPGITGGYRLRKDGKPDGRGLRSARSKDAASSKNLNATNLLLGIHQMLAEFTGIPEFVLAESEAKEYGDAAIELCNELNIPITRKQIAIGNFIGAVTKIYATRWTAFKIRKMMEREMRPEHVEVIRETARRQAAQEENKQPQPMPTPANMGQARDDANGQPKFAPSARWPEPAENFPGMP